jgi:type IV pilus assembly protein PilB
MMKLNSQIREMTFAQAPSQTLRKIARETGMRTLLEDGILKSLKGSTTLEEVLSSCHAEVLELQGSVMHT